MYSDSAFEINYCGLQLCDSSTSIVLTTVQVQLSVVSIRMHIHLVLLVFIGNVSLIQNKTRHIARLR